jgi:hypothetical protein
MFYCLFRVIELGSCHRIGSEWRPVNMGSPGFVKLIEPITTARAVAIVNNGELGKNRA